jgi:hypothetical protein
MPGQANRRSACSAETSYLAHTSALLDEIRKDQEALANYIAEHGDPAAELAAMFGPSLYLKLVGLER